MSDSPTSPPSNATVRLPTSADAGEWAQLEEPVPQGANEAGDEAEVIGCMLAYARKANAQMLVVMSEGGNQKCALVFRFEEEKEEFLRLLQGKSTDPARRFRDPQS